MLEEKYNEKEPVPFDSLDDDLKVKMRSLYIFLRPLNKLEGELNIWCLKKMMEGNEQDIKKLVKAGYLNERIEKKGKNTVRFYRINPKAIEILKSNLNYSYGIILNL
ncbi:MAG: hypothetical protein QXL86_02060 [Candidatus Aenigmatarchaeota archaeon]